MHTIIKNKTRREHEWQLSVKGHNIGIATATYKTATQRAWAVDIDFPAIEFKESYSGYPSIAKLCNAIEADLSGFEINENVVEPEEKEKYVLPRKLVTSMITEKNVFELSKHYGYNVVSTVSAEQVEYLKAELRKRNALYSKVPMADLIDVVGKKTFVTKGFECLKE